MCFLETKCWRKRWPDADTYCLLLDWSPLAVKLCTQNTLCRLGLCVSGERILRVWVLVFSWRIDDSGCIFWMLAQKNVDLFLASRQRLCPLVNGQSGAPSGCCSCSGAGHQGRRSSLGTHRHARHCKYHTHGAAQNTQQGTEHTDRYSNCARASLQFSSS